MIINNVPVPTELNFYTYRPPNNLTLPFNSNNQNDNDKESHSDKKSRYMVNNVINEIELIKQKNLKNEINYIDFLIITEEEYTRCLEEVELVINDLNEEDIIDILSIQKLISVYKHIFEIFSYLISEPYFEWKKFKEKLNLHEVKLKMSNMSVNSFNSRMINSYLNKISKNSKFSEEYFHDDNGVNKIFKWIKAVLKVYLYKIQQRQNVAVKSNLNKMKDKVKDKEFNAIVNSYSINSILSSNAISKLGKSDILDKVNEDKVIDLKLKGNSAKITEQKDRVNSHRSTDVFFTGVSVSGIINNSNPINVKRNIPFPFPIPLSKAKLPKLKTKIMKLDLDIVNDKIIKEKKTLESLPLLNNKTFIQLRNYFERLTGKGNKTKNGNNLNLNINNNDMEKIGMMTQIDMEKMVHILSRDRLKHLTDHSLNQFINSMKPDADVIQVRWKIMVNK